MTFASEPDVVRYAAAVSVWGRWFVFLVVLFQFVYRPGFWYYGHYEYTSLLVPLAVFNGLVHYRLLRRLDVTWHWLLLLSAMDVTVATVGVVFQGGFPGFVFLAYYPALALFVVVFTSVWLGLAWTTVTAIVYALVCLIAGTGLDIVAGHEKELLVRIAAMYALVLCVSLIARFERTKRQEAVDRELALQRERVDFSRAVHDTSAQSAYMIGLGIDAVKEAAGDFSEELNERIDATSRLSKLAILQLRHPIDLGRIFDGRDLGGALDSHVSTFAHVTAVKAELTQTGVEPPLPTETRSTLFTIAHNALTNAFRHADASNVGVAVDFGLNELRLSVSDDGKGLPEDYKQRGHGFANMNASASRLGAKLIVEPIGADGGAGITCVMPFERRERDGLDDI